MVTSAFAGKVRFAGVYSGHPDLPSILPVSTVIVKLAFATALEVPAPLPPFVAFAELVELAAGFVGAVLACGCDEAVWELAAPHAETLNIDSNATPLKTSTFFDFIGKDPL